MVLTACGRAPNNIDPAFVPLYNQFMSQANSAGLGLNLDQALTIKFTPLEQETSLGEIIGECSGVGFGGGLITIDPTYWNSADSITQEILLYHELGHCVLGEIHAPQPNAIMNALINYPIEYDAQMPAMISKLFHDVGDGLN